MILTSGLTIVSYIICIGPDRLAPQAVRFTLTGLLLWWVWSGSRVARWIAIVLFASGGALAGLVALSAAAPVLFRIAHALILAVYLPFACRLALPTSVHDYLESRRAAP